MIESGFNQETIKNAIHTKWAGKTVHFAEITDSTNLWAKKLAQKKTKCEAGTNMAEREMCACEADVNKVGREANACEAGTKGISDRESNIKSSGKYNAEHGTLVVAEQQTAGRGRLGRKWVSPAGSCVMMSLLLRPEFAPQYAPMLTLVMGLSVAQAVEKLNEKTAAEEKQIQVAIKWPNDVVVSGKKICGILTEMSLEGMLIREVVIGVGINVNLSDVEDEIKDVATSLYLETGRKYDRNHVINLVMQQFETNYEKYIRTLDLTYLIEDYNNLLINRDKQVRVLDPKEPFEGIARGITVQGELLVERSDGEVAAVGAGEVSVRGLYGYV